MKQSKSATDKLIAHFGNPDPTKPDKHSDEYRQIIVASRHSKLAVGADGQILRGTLAFKDALPHHVRFCMWMADSLRPLAVAHDEGFRSFCDSLHPGYVPPHRNTVWKILELIQQLTLENLKQQLMAVKAQIGSPFISLQTDMWTTRDMRESYASLNGSFITRKHGIGGTSEYALVQAQLAFRKFPYLRHTGAKILLWIRAELKILGLTEADVVVIVPDGGGNVKKACKMSTMNYRICYAHQLQRCVMYSLGLAGKQSQNEDLKEHIMKGRKLAPMVHHSTQITKQLAAARAKREESQVSIHQDVDTRWFSTYEMMKSLNLLQPDLQTVCNAAEINEVAMQIQIEMNRLETSWREGAAGEDSADESAEDDSLMLSNTPRDCMYSDAEFATNRYVEGWTKPAADAQLMLEGDSYVCGNKGYPSINNKVQGKTELE